MSLFLLSGNLQRFTQFLSIRYVLPNHYIFQLAEQPPADMAAMLKIFHFVPPVLRRRAKELLDVIRESVRWHLSSDQGKPSPVATAVNPIQDAAVEQQPLPKTDSSTATSLWTLGQNLSPLHCSWIDQTFSLDVSAATSSVSSSLFGSVKIGSIKPTESRSTIFAPQSTLFGRTIPIAGSQEVSVGVQNVLTAYRYHTALPFDT